MLNSNELLDALLADETEEDDTPHKPKSQVETAPAKNMKMALRTPELTEGNIELLAFVGKFPGATIEAISMVQTRQANRFHDAGLRSLGGVEVTMRKLKGMGLADTYRDLAAKVTYWSTTKEGLETLNSLGIDTSAMQTLHGVAKSRAAHYSAIAQVAAQLYSPGNYFQSLLGTPPLSLDAIISEKEMRNAFEPVKAALRAAKKVGQPSEYGPVRSATMEARIEQIAQGKLSSEDLLEAEPLLWTLGFKPYENSILKPIHQPDMAARVPGRGMTPGQTIC